MLRKEGRLVLKGGEVRKLIKATLCCRTNLWLWSDREEGADLQRWQIVGERQNLILQNYPNLQYIQTYIWDISQLCACPVWQQQQVDFFYWQKWVPRFVIGAIKSWKSFFSLNMARIFCAHQFVIFLLELNLTIRQYHPAQNPLVPLCPTVLTQSNGCTYTPIKCTPILRACVGWIIFWENPIFASKPNFSWSHSPGCGLMVIASYPTVDNRESGGMQSLVVNQH